MATLRAESALLPEVHLRSGKSIASYERRLVSRETNPRHRRAGEANCKEAREPAEASELQRRCVSISDQTSLR
jgi:hypothetical protein